MAQSLHKPGVLPEARKARALTWKRSHSVLRAHPATAGEQEVFDAIGEAHKGGLFVVVIVMARP